MAKRQPLPPTPAAALSALAAPPAGSQTEQRIRAGQQAHLWLAAIMGFAQLWLYCRGRLVVTTSTAAWWALAFAPLGGLLVWLPTALLLRPQPRQGLEDALRRALGPVGGGLVCSILGLTLVLDAIICQHALIDLCTLYLLPDTSSNLQVSLLAAAALIAMLWQGSTTSASRLAFAHHLRLLVCCLVLVALLMRDGNVNNLYPLGGHGVPQAIGSGLLSGSAFGTLFVLGFVPRLTEGSPKTGFRQGLSIIGGVALLTLVVQLTMSITLAHGSQRSPLTWAVRMMINTRLLARWDALSAVLAALQIFLLVVAAQGGLAYGEHALHQLAPASPRFLWQAVVSALVLASAWFNSPAQERLLIAWLPWRLVVAVPLWLAYAAAALRKRKEARA